MDRPQPREGGWAAKIQRRKTRGPNGRRDAPQPKGGPTQRGGGAKNTVGQKCRSGFAGKTGEQKKQPRLRGGGFDTVGQKYWNGVRGQKCKAEATVSGGTSHRRHERVGQDQARPGGLCGETRCGRRRVLSPTTPFFSSLTYNPFSVVSCSTPLPFIVFLGIPYLVFCSSRLLLLLICFESLCVS